MIDVRIFRRSCSLFSLRRRAWNLGETQLEKATSRLSLFDIKVTAQ